MVTKKDIVIGTFTGVLGNIAYALFKWLLNPKNIGSFIDFLCIQIPLWYFLSVVFIVVIVLLIIAHFRKKPVFLKHTEEVFGGLTFQWRWSYEQDKQKYFMKDLTALCPECGRPLYLNSLNNTYNCSNGHAYYFDQMYATRKDMLHHLKQKYKDYSSIIHFPDEM